MRKFKGAKINFDQEFEGVSEFVSFGQMASGEMVYHEVVNGEEQSGIFYLCKRFNGNRYFIAEGED